MILSNWNTSLIPHYYQRFLDLAEKSMVAKGMQIDFEVTQASYVSTIFNQFGYHYICVCFNIRKIPKITWQLNYLIFLSKDLNKIKGEICLVLPGLLP